MTALNFPANPSNGDVYENYQYDGTDGVWKRLPSSSLGINGLADVTITTPADGESLVYDNATGEWINADATVEVYGVDTAETSYFSLPKGTDEQRPVSPSNGDIRFNTDSGSPEWYSADNNEWILFRSAPSFSVEYLVIAGGGGAGYFYGGGGGAGGYRSNVTGENSGGGASAEPVLSLASGTYTVTVGAGGAGAGTTNGPGTDGSNSVFYAITSAGGGAGGGNTSVGNSGGSGGGGSNNRAGGAGTVGQGFAGGFGATNLAGGGGGAGEIGNTDASGAGGDGVASSITGSSVFRAGGGEGALPGTSGGGDGGGGAINTAGTVNTGGGGGGGNGGSSAAGGSGVVIIKYPAAYTATPTVGLTSSTTPVGDFKVTTFTAGTGSVIFS